MLFIEHDRRDRCYVAVARLGRIDFSDYDAIREQKLLELSHIQNYARCTGCYMGYLTAYLGDLPGYSCGTCGSCQPMNFPTIKPSERIQKVVRHFLEEEWFPAIEKRGTAKAPAHEAGWSLSYHGTSRLGKLVRASKYEEAGPFPSQLVARAVEVIRTRYPMATIDGIVSVPPTRSGMLVENFARQVAASLGIALSACSYEGPRNARAEVLNESRAEGR